MLRRALSFDLSARQASLCRGHQHQHKTPESLPGRGALIATLPAESTAPVPSRRSGFTLTPLHPVIRAKAGTHTRQTQPHPTCARITCPPPHHTGPSPPRGRAPQHGSDDVTAGSSNIDVILPLHPELDQTIRNTRTGPETFLITEVCTRAANRRTLATQAMKSTRSALKTK